MNKLNSWTSRVLAGALVAGALAAVGIAPASAHVSITMYGEKAVAGKGAVLFARIPHGQADKLTTKVEVQIPAGVTAVKPQHIAGWTESTTLAADGKTVATVVWTGGNLPDSSFQDFGIKVTLPATPGATLYFKTVQTMNDGSQDAWIEIPAEGQASPAKPAPSVKLLDPAALVADTTTIAQNALDAKTAATDLKAQLDTANAKISALTAELEASRSGGLLEGSVSKKSKKASFVADTSTTNRSKSVSLQILDASGNVIGTAYTGKLDSRGDLSISIDKAKSGKGAYSISSGTLVRLVAGSKTLATTTVN